MRILAVVNISDLPDISLEMRSGRDLTNHISKMIGTVTPSELLKKSATVEIDFGELGIRLIPRKKATFIADMSEY